MSPQLVDAISRTTQVVWATTRKQEGLTGRSDIRLQTAVGMPVAVDGDGNMCIVVMFSPKNIQSSDEAMEYLQSISMSATSSNIPCILPVFDSKTTHPALPPLDDSHHMHHHLVQMPQSVLGEGVNARYVCLDDTHQGEKSTESDPHRDYELSAAPKDTFGIPMLPSFTESGQKQVTYEDDMDVFDEASYGIWSTIMESLGDMNSPVNAEPDSRTPAVMRKESLHVMLPPSHSMSDERRERLSEFCEAFLGMSVFDYADVWVPASEHGYVDCLRLIMSSINNVDAEGLSEFKGVSEHALIKFWSGAVGRAFSSGNPVWSANPEVFIDSTRTKAFQRSHIQTVLAVPVFARECSTPTCVVACYSMVRSSSVPFVLRFVQQALRLLWHGIDTVEPHESVDHNIWKEVAPADLGEMAADLEMQQHFISKKRPHNRIQDESSSELNASWNTSGFHRIQLPNGETIEVPLQLSNDSPSVPLRVETVQNHMTQALRHVRDALPFDNGSSSSQPIPKRHHYASIASNGNIGQPLQRPRSFPRAVVPSQSSTKVFSHGMDHELMQQKQMMVNGETGSMAGPQKPNAPMTMPTMHQARIQDFSQPEQFGMTSSSPNSINIPLMNEGSMERFCLPVQAGHYLPQAFGSESIDDVDGDDNCCRIDGCNILTTMRRPYCEQHSGNRLCEHSGCGKCAQGSTRFCIAHGGGRRCTWPGCDKGARDKFFCAAHGGGKRCKQDGCNKSAVGGSSLCTAHGGGRRCAVDGCDKSAQSSTSFCVKHGGGKKCSHDGCEKVARGRTPYCAAHGGGVRCKLDGCNRVAIGRMQLCRAHGGTSSRSRKAPRSAGQVKTDTSSLMHMGTSANQQQSVPTSLHDMITNQRMAGV